MDVVLNLDDGLHMPYRKPNAKVEYVNIKSNHPPIVLMNIPKGVEERLSKLSSNEHCFNIEKNIYQDALNNAGHSYQLKMKQRADNVNVATYDIPSQNSEHSEINVNSQQFQKKRQRKRNILWFNPPYNDYIEHGVGQTFFN